MIVRDSDESFRTGAQEMVTGFDKCFMSAVSARRAANVVGDNAFPLARERNDQSGGAVSPSLGVYAFYPCGGERASVRLPLRKN